LITFWRLNGSVTPLRLMTATMACSTVVKRRPHSWQLRRRRMAWPSSCSRESTTRESGWRQYGHRIALPPVDEPAVIHTSPNCDHAGSSTEAVRCGVRTAAIRFAVVDSREQDEGQAIRRRRSCQECGRRFTTVEQAMVAVIKRSGVTEPFSRQKVINGVRRACQGRPVDEDALAQLAQTVEEAIRATGAAEVQSDEVGLAILARCASSTRWHTCASPACTRHSPRSTTSTRRSPSCAPRTGPPSRARSTRTRDI